MLVKNNDLEITYFAFQYIYTPELEFKLHTQNSCLFKLLTYNNLKVDLVNIITH